MSDQLLVGFDLICGRERNLGVTLKLFLVIGREILE
jgi:hypothetical protein